MVHLVCKFPINVTVPCEAGLPRGVVLMDAGYGVDTDLRMDITAVLSENSIRRGGGHFDWRSGKSSLLLGRENSLFFEKNSLLD
jgi:hypothetical protein